MLKSMTAFGRAGLATRAGHFTIEIHSVNRKHLEVNVILPPELSRFDPEIKKWLMLFVGRGQVTIKVTASFEEIIPFVVRPNLPLAHQLKIAWYEIIKKLHLEEQEFRLSLLSETPGLFLYEENQGEEEIYRQTLKNVFDDTLKNFLKMKEEEGGVLQADIAQRLKMIQASVHVIEQKTPYATERYREKLMARLEEILPGHVENEDRILREIALFAEKIDITEEITRILFHLTHFEELMQSADISIGKTLEFVLQEINREITTIGNKSSNLEIARAVIDIKSELERIREQIQNVE